MITVIASLIALFAATCGVNSTDPPDEKQPPDQTQEDQAFCCFSVGVTPSGNGTGSGCVTIGSGNIDSCDKVLSCGPSWIKDGSTVTCL
jgi:hypothetical protein